MNWRALILVFAIPVIATLPACREKAAIATTNPLLKAYDVEQDANDPQRVIPLNYQQAQGKRVFNSTCVWCHAEATPAGPSNRSNVTPTPPLFTDGETLNPLTDEFLQNTITLGGSAMGKSTMMPPWGQTLREDEIRSVIAYIRAVAQPPYEPAARPASQYPVK
jgi:mono/diheme cytochrome c family protein